MKRLLLFVIISLFVCTDAVFAQKEYNNWILSDYWMCGLSFNTRYGDAHKMNNDILSFEKSSSISDSAGNLLFYTDGEYVYSRYGKTMAGGIGLNQGYYNSPIIIVPQPGNNCFYYIFVAPGHNRKAIFNYSIVDLSLGDGFGEVLLKNVNLPDSSSTCLAAVGQEAGTLVWIATTDSYSHILKAYLLDEDSVHTNPIISPYKNRFRNSELDKIKFSPDGKKLAMTNFLDSALILFDFDDETGEFSNEVVVDLRDKNPQFLEFSPDSKLIYIISRKIYESQIGQIKYLFQYDIASGNATEISNSEFLVYETINYQEGLKGLQIGPNNKIYTSHHYYDAFATDTTNIMLISEPNLRDTACKLIIKDLKPFKGIIYDFPACVQNYYPRKKTCIHHNISICEGDELMLYSPFHDDVKYQWTGPKPNIHSTQNPRLPNSSPEHSGNYYFRITRDDIEINYDSIDVKIYPKPKILINGMKPISLCADTTLHLLAVADPYRLTIRWRNENNSIVSKENLVKISRSGTYTVVVENEFGCMDSASIEIKIKKPVKLKILCEVTTICTGEEIVLSANEVYDEYLWSTGEDTPSITVNEGGVYSLYVKNENGCDDYYSVTITELEKPLVEFENFSYALCKGDSLILTPLEVFYEYEYTWSDGYKGFRRVFKENANLFLIVKSYNGCTDTAQVIVGFYDVPEVKILADKTEACYGEKITLKVDDYNPNLHYLWSNGQKGEGISVTVSGTYSLIVRIGTFCSDTTEIEVKFHDPLNLKLLSENHDPCSTDSVKLYIEFEYAEYLWSTGETSEYIIARQTGTYWVKVKNSIGCSDSASINLLVQNLPIPIIVADKTEACFGEKITLKADNYNPDFSYLWSNGQTDESITVSESGIYKLIVSNENLCSDTAEIEIKIHPDLALEILADKTNLCYDDSTSIYSSSTYADYLWSTGETTPTITTKEAGIYQLIAKNEFGCADTAEIEIFKFDAKIEIDKEKLIFDEICVGESQERRINLKLVAGNEFRISRIATTSNNFEIRSSKELLNNGESAEITVIFKPKEAGFYDNEIVIESTVPCIFSKSLPILASSKQIIEFSIENHYAEAGQYLEIPLFAEIKCPEPLNESLDYEITVEFDKEYFAADSLKFGEIKSNQIVDNKRIIVIKANGNFNQNKSVVNVIYGNAFLGRTEVTDILVNDTKLFKTRYFPEYINGSLSVDGCVNDITTIRMFNPTKMTVSPNPTDGELKVSIGTQEQGSFRLVVNDLQGREVWHIEFTKNDKTYLQKEFNINTQNMSNGIYTIHLTAPWTLLREQVGIVR